MTGLTKGQVKKAGNILSDKAVTGSQLEWALGIADEWRSAHREPLEEMESLAKAAVQVVMGKNGGGAFVASRIKRLESIIGKLRRPNLRMKLNEMNDIAGCRVVVPIVDDVRRIVAHLTERASVKERNGIKNYIQQ